MSCAWAQAAGPGGDPAWKSKILGSTLFDHGGMTAQGDSRSGTDRWVYDVNEQGLISGEELAAQLGSIPDFDSWVKMQAARGLIPADKQSDTEGLRAKYQGFLKDRSELAFASLVLNRIIDHEAMKRKLRPTAVDDLRVRYVLRATLIQNAISEHKVRTRAVDSPLKGNPFAIQILMAKDLFDGKKPKAPGSYSLTSDVLDEDLSHRPDQELYDWFRDRITRAQANPETTGINLRINWQARDGEAGPMLEALKLLRSPAFPEFVIPIQSRLPEKVEDFAAMIRSQLQAVNTQLWREGVLESLTQGPLLTTEAQAWTDPSRVDAAEVARAYDALLKAGASGAAMVQQVSAKITSYRVSGKPELVAAFRSTLDRLSRERSKAVQAELFGATKKPRAEIERKLRELRSSAPAELIGLAKSDFIGNVVLGELSISGPFDEELARNPRDPQSDPEHAADPDAEARRDWVFSNLEALQNQIVPRTDRPLERGGAEIVFLRDLAARPLKLEEPLVSDGAWDTIMRAFVANRREEAESAREEKRRPYLQPIPKRETVSDLVRAIVAGKRRSFLVREKLDRLLEDNPFRFDTNLCVDPAWPCLDSTPRKLTETLAREQLYEGASIAPLSSTVGRRDLADRVFSIQLAPVFQAAELPNDRR